MILVTTTVSNKKQAKQIAKCLLSKNLVACINIIACSSMYIWQEKVIIEKEYKLFIKSQKQHFRKIEEEILKKHSYAIPEICCIAIDKMTKKYHNWIVSVT